MAVGFFFRILVYAMISSKLCIMLFSYSCMPFVGVDTWLSYVRMRVFVWGYMHIYVHIIYIYIYIYIYMHICICYSGRVLGHTRPGIHA
jgi:hypothetical protein